MGHSDTPESKKKRGKIMNAKITDLYEAYILGVINRRKFIKQLTLLAGGTAAAYALIPLLENRVARAEMVPVDDSRLFTGTIQYPAATGPVQGYLARLKDDAKRPGVVVIHENRGLNSHIKDVNRRLALEGFLAMAPDALSPLGGTPKDPDQARSMINSLDMTSTINNFTAAVKYLKTHPQTAGKVGVVGFCWGGAMANQVAVKSSDVTAAVPYYGRQPASQDVPKIKASLLLHYAGLDERINAGIPAFESALKKASVDYRIYMYEGANHAFNNDTNAERYHKDAAGLAWKRTVSFLSEKLKE
jgi:carboxymethylenebutenolidase